ncbi:MAG: YjbH domain-containing protein [Rhodocyclaceae bacterium]
MAHAQAAPDTIIPGERLSAWILRQPRHEEAYLPGLLWSVPEEVARQAQLKQTLVDTLAAQPGMAALSAWLKSRPVTGRAAVSSPEPHWLEGRPAEDPILRTGQRVNLPPRPKAVAVVLENGDVCQVAYRSGGLVVEYLRACVASEDIARREVAWVVQPDGRQQHFGIARWNLEEQTSPAPGAWIWAPRTDSDVDEDVSERLVRFLATQGAADEGVGYQVPNPSEIRPSPRPRALPLTSNDWGEIGLLQTPTARMPLAGDLRVHISHVAPYTRTSVILQPLDWLQGAFRYTNISGVPYDPTFTISDQTYKDKSIDFRVRFWQESHYLPELAIGVRDLGGTGLFSGEYVVANKRFGDFDWSLGLGWGYLGARGNAPNPFGLVSDRFKTRGAASRAGETNSQNYFRGRTSLFGGVQWHTPYDPLILKLEYDGNDYQSEPFKTQSQRIPFNVGATWQVASALDLSFGVERGKKLMFGLTLHTDVSRAASPKAFDPPYPPLPAAAAPRTDWSAASAELGRQTGWYVERIEQVGGTLHVKLDDAGSAYRQERLDRAAAVLNVHAPATVTRFSIDFVSRGLAIDSQIIERADWVARKTSGDAPARRGYRGLAYGTAATRLAELNGQAADLPRAPTGDADATTTPAQGSAAPPATEVLSDTPQRLRGGLQPSFYQSFGGPDAFMLYQIGVRGWTEFRLTPSTLLSASANLRLLDNYDKYKFTAVSDLPRVRTYIREYVTSSRFTLSNLQLTHVEQLSTNQFGSVYGGLLESMFAGVGAEYLYRPVASRWAIGVDVNRVRQRDFDQGLGLLDYSVTTGHATLYWNTGWNGVMARVAAGRYLAGDKGVTLDLSRRFDNGVIIGAWATKTNVSAEQFGEGSFDKGIYISLPFDSMLPRSSTVTGNFVWQPLLRDGGAMLARAQRLYSLTGTRDRDAFTLAPPKNTKNESPTTGEDLFAPPAP